MINLSVGPNQKNAWDLLCAFISDYLAKMIEDRYERFFLNSSDNPGNLRNNRSFSSALILDHLFPPYYPEDEAADVFLSVYSILRADKIYRPGSPVMQMILFRLLSYRITSFADHSHYMIDLPEETRKALSDAYAADYDRKLKSLENPNVISKSVYVDSHIKYYLELSNYIELLFDEPEFLLINNVTREDIAKNPLFYRGFVVGSDPNLLILSLIDKGCLIRMVPVKADTFPFKFLD